MLLSFSAAESFCNGFGGHLAIPRSLNQFNEIVEFNNKTGFDPKKNFWLGLFDSNDVGGTDPVRFIGVNGELIPFVGEVERGEFPWGDNPSEPSDSNSVENCVEFQKKPEGSDLLNDKACDTINQFICERSCVGDCIAGIQYTMNTQLSNFTEAQEFCTSIGGQLAIPSSIEQLNEIKNFSATFDEKVILGLLDINNIGGIGNTKRFIGVDGQPNGFTNRNSSVFPWGDNNPNDFQGKENCVGIDTIQSENLLDVDCNLRVYTSVCETYCGSRPAFVFDECIDGTQFYFSNELLSYDESTANCKSIDVKGKLAIPDSQEKFERMLEFLVPQPSRSGPAAWMGLRNFVEVEGTENFITVDGEFNIFTSGTLGDPPWLENRPDNFNNDFCVSLEYAPELLDDRECEGVLQSLCERPCTENDVKTDFAFTFGSCVNGIQLFVNQDSLTFDEASVACSSFDETATLAVPFSGDKFIQMRDFRAMVGVNNPYIGLRNFAEDITAATESFLSINNKTNPFTAGEKGIFPWESNEPNNSNNLGQFCGIIKGSASQNLDDESCDNQFPSICERYCGIRPSFIFDECIEEIQFFFNPELRTFDAAEADCRSVGGTLAIPTDENIFLNISSLFELHKTSNNAAFIGLRDFFDKSINTADFRSVDGDLNNFTSVTIGEAPWLSGEPNGADGGNRCVALSPGEEGLIDTVCLTPSFSVCQRQCPDFDTIEIDTDDSEADIDDDIFIEISYLGASVGCLVISIIIFILRHQEKKHLAKLNAKLDDINTFLNNHEVEDDEEVVEQKI